MDIFIKNDSGQNLVGKVTHDKLKAMILLKSGLPFW